MSRSLDKAADEMLGRPRSITVRRLIIRTAIAMRHLATFEHRACADREVCEASIAAVEPALSGADALRLATGGANGTLRPALRLEIEASALVVRKHLEKLEGADR